MLPRLALVLALALTATAAADPPRVRIAAPQQTVREWEVPRPPIVIERPPRRFEEITTVETFEITPRESIDLSGLLEARPVYTRPALEVPTYAAPAARVPVTYAVPATYTPPATYAAPAARVPVATLRTGCLGKKQNVFFSDGTAQYTSRRP